MNSTNALIGVPMWGSIVVNRIKSSKIVPESLRSNLRQESPKFRSFTSSQQGPKLEIMMLETVSNMLMKAVPGFIHDFLRNIMPWWNRVLDM